MFTLERPRMYIFPSSYFLRRLFFRGNKTTGSFFIFVIRAERVICVFVTGSEECSVVESVIVAQNEKYKSLGRVDGSLLF